MPERAPAYAIKAEIRDPDAAAFAFTAAKTMYGGRAIAAGDPIFLFASENEGGSGLFARAVVTASEAVPRREGIARQTPRVTIAVATIARARRPLGRAQLRGFRDWKDGRAETELNFKFYRQATDKIVGLSPAAAAFLDGFFRSPRPRTGYDSDLERKRSNRPATAAFREQVIVVITLI